MPVGFAQRLDIKAHFKFNTLQPALAGRNASVRRFGRWPVCFRRHPSVLPAARIGDILPA